jgi:type VI secretion system secreted protein Hcp
MKTKIFVRWFIFLSGLLLLANPLRAAIYLKIEGPVIEGEVTAQNYAKQIEVLSFQQAISVLTTNAPGGPPQAGPPKASDITITKYLDKSSPTLFLQCNQGTPIAKMTFSFVTSGAQGPVRYYQVYLEQVLISGISQSSGGDRPAESVSLTFTRIRWSYWPQNADGSLGTKVESGWDYVANAPF